MTLPGRELFARGGKDSSELAEVRSRRKHARDHHVAFRHDGFNRHLDIGELLDEPFDNAPHVLRSFDRARFVRTEGRRRVLHVIGGGQLLEDVGVPVVEAFFEPAAHEIFVGVRHQLPSASVSCEDSAEGDTSDMDLAAYRARIRDDGPVEPDFETLRRIHVAHVTTIPFENLDIHLGRPINLDLPSIESKLVRAHRGGYCFEQNTLLAAALETIGFRVTRLGARVGEGDPRFLKRTHMVLLVHVGESDMIADVGFGAGELLEPLPFRVGEPVTQHGRTFEIVQTEYGYTLRETGHERTRELYQFNLEEQYDVDREIANHYTSTHPDSGFVRTLTVQLDGIERYWIVRGRLLQTVEGNTTMETDIRDDEQLLGILASVFDLRFPPGTVFRSPNL